MPRGGEDVAAEELVEAVEQEGVDGRVLAMPCAERAEGGEETVGEGSAIDLLDEGCLCLVGLLEEKGTQVFGQLLLEDVAHESLTDVGPAAFIAQNVAEGRNARVEVAPIIVAGVAACAENGNDAGLSSAETSCCTEHVAFHMDLGVLADDLPKCLCHDGGFLRSASCSVEVDGGELRIWE